MVFLSYSSKNAKEAENIYYLFLEAGFKVWYAPKSIEEGTDYGESVINAIENCKVFVLLLSEESNKSNHVLTEVEIAFKHKKHIFPARIENILPTKSLEYRISTMQWIDLFQDIDMNISRFIETIRKKLEITKDSTDIILNKDISPSGKNQSYSLVTKTDNILKYLKEAINIDKQYYKEELAGILEICLQWYEANNEIYTFIVDKNDNVVAYFNAMIIDDELFQNIKEGKFMDNDIPADAIIEPFLPGVYHLYFCSIAIDQKHNDHKIEIFSLLYKGFFDKLRQWAEKDFYIEEIIADAVTLDGKKISQSFGLTKFGETEHSTTLYYTKMLPPKFKGNKEAQIVFNKYKSYYESFYV